MFSKFLLKIYILKTQKSIEIFIQNTFGDQFFSTYQQKKGEFYKKSPISKCSQNFILQLALLAIMVVDIQREYRFYSEKEEIRLQKNMDIRRKYVGIARRVRSTQNRPAAASDLRG